MKSLLKIAILSILLMSVYVGVAQTNVYYYLGEADLSLNAGLTLPSLVNTHNRYGGELAVTYWQTRLTGTSVSLGLRDFNAINPALIEYTAAFEKLRIIPFTTPALSRFDIELETGTDKWLTTGSQGIIIGLGANYSFTTSSSVGFQFREAFETVPICSGATLFGGFTYKF